MKKFILTIVSLILTISSIECGSCFAISQSKSYSVPGGQLISDAWRSTFCAVSGNTLQWDYQVSAKYNGNKRVKRIRTSFKGSASLRNSASMNIGVSETGASAGGGSSWQSVFTTEKYWENTNGQKTSSYRSNMVVAPKKDYRNDTISIINRATVEIEGDKRCYEITASV
ncbi:MAG: hypothetical protein RUMPE_00898 [Eubacteriales bacterium SKADARSKE-1]|nr:hypothetical protein [Eubacteriales bacterium SKADARSKE-1]